jgi:hypothetical protein
MLLCAALVLASACARRIEPPSPDRPAPVAPDLTGKAVMVLPAQHGPSGGASGQEPVPGLDREIAFWLAERGPRVRWIFPPQIQRALDRTPSMNVQLHALAVSSFHRAQVEIIGDPLFGDLRALNVLVDARYALIPVAAGFGSDSAGARRVQINAALIDTVGGRVLWFGAVAGEPGAEDSPGITASAAQALARAVIR